MGMRFEYWEVGFEKKLGWEMGLVPPPPSGPSKEKRCSKQKGCREEGEGSGGGKEPLGHI